MKKPTPAEQSLLITRTTRTVYFFLAFFAASIIIFDAGNLITREAVIDRWTLLSVATVINTLIWFVSSRSIKGSHAILITTLAGLLLAFAGFMTYWERGMASTSTILYALPLLVVGILKNRHALIAFAALSVSMYSFAAVKYFNDFFNEGFRIQLWGTIILVSGAIITVTWLVMLLTGLRHDSK